MAILLGLQSVPFWGQRVGDKRPQFDLLCPQNGTAVHTGLMTLVTRAGSAAAILLAE